MNLAILSFFVLFTSINIKQIGNIYKKTAELVSGLRLERVKGIEPSYEVWKTPALPLSYTRVMSIHSFKFLKTFKF